MKVNWEAFVQEFLKAFLCGNLTMLLTLRNLRVEGFHNLDDLGGDFLKYGSGFDRWEELIADSRENGKHAIRSVRNRPMTQSQWQKAFYDAFAKGDMDRLQDLEKMVPPQGHICFGPRFDSKYMNQFTPEFIENVDKNREAWIAFCDKFNKAFYAGDVETLIALKFLEVQGFNKLSDVGPQFEKYDSKFFGIREFNEQSDAEIQFIQDESEFCGWARLIYDAASNRNK